MHLTLSVLLLSLIHILIDMSPAMIGTVPMYDAIGYLEKDLLEITAQDFLKVVQAHARD